MSLTEIDSAAIIGESWRAVLDRYMRPPFDGELEATKLVYPKQYDFIVSESHHHAFVAGLGAGKTYAGAVRALRAAYGRVGGKRIPAPNLGLVTAPTFKMLADTDVDMFRKVAQPWILRHNKSEMKTEMRNGSEILWRSVTDPDTLRGLNLSWIWMDEAALYESGVFEILVARLRQHNRLGHEWITTTPKGKNWLYQKFAADPKPGYEMVIARFDENPYLHPDYKQLLLDSYEGDLAEQELYAQFIDRQGIIYYMFSHTRHVVKDLRPYYKDVIAGVDWGIRNPGAIAVIGIDYDGVATVIDEEYRTRTPIDNWVAIAKDFHNRYGVSRFYCDSSEPEFIRLFNSEPGISAVGATGAVLPGIDGVINRLTRGTLLVHNRCVNTIREFEVYEWMDKGRAEWVDTPRKKDDHLMDCIRMALDRHGVGQSETRLIRYA